MRIVHHFIAEGFSRECVVCFLLLNLDFCVFQLMFKILIRLTMFTVLLFASLLPF